MVIDKEGGETNWRNSGYLVKLRVNWVDGCTIYSDGAEARRNGSINTILFHNFLN